MVDPTQPQVDIIVPVFNEEEALSSFHTQLTGVIDSLPFQFTIYYINDGSTDQTMTRLEALASQDARLVVAELSRNFGHQAALTAGLDLSQGDWAISLDGDGQHPPEKIPEMLALAQSGYEIVICQRMDESGGSRFKQRTSQLFYTIINRIGEMRIQPGAADFRLLSRAVVAALRDMPEYHRFLRGMVAWVGFRSAILPYHQPQRLGGRSKYSLSKMFHLAMDAIFSFSRAPIFIAMTIGLLFLGLAVIEVFYVLSFWVSGQQASLAPGWSSLMFMLLCVGGSLMVALGFTSIYVGYIFQEVKRRPVYLIRHTIHMAQGESRGKKDA